MAFRASTVRQRKAKPVAQGKPLIANAGLEDWYYKSMARLIRDMSKDYRSELDAAFGKRVVKAFYVGDASPTSILTRTLRRLRTKWTDVFSVFARNHADTFAQRGDDFSKFSSRHSLKALGIADPKSTGTAQLSEVVKSSIAENVALITNIQEDFAKDIEGTVFRSIASNNPADGSQAVVAKLLEREDMTLRRARTIARDQNSKLYTNLNKARMEQNGVELFRWRHSSAGKTQRHTHVQRQTQDVGHGPGVFRFDSPELWEGPRNDQGLPGEAINCRCRMIPIIDLD